ncbi:MIC26 MICOS subunit MIC26 [Candida maltosa Xu316]
MTKRQFYEDDEYILNKPGTTTPIPSQLEAAESIHGNATFIDGMVIRTTPILETYANKLRHYIHDKVSLWGAELNTQKSAFNNEFKNLSYEIDSLIQEPVLPGLIYILTIGLTGSILVRKRNLLVRFITPVLFGGVALNWFMPRTASGVAMKYDELESKNLPELHIQREIVQRSVEEFKKEADRSLEDAEKSVVQAVHDFRKLVQEKWE